MPELLQILNNSTDYLKSKGVESPRLQAELLLSHALGVKRLELYLQFDRTLFEAELQKIRPLLKRRASHEPLQHILGETNFYGHTLKCSPAALIPRPETEQLVEQIIQEMKDQPPGLIYDVGTGTGAIALSLSLALPEWNLRAIDISPEALTLARENHALHPEARVEWIEGNLLEDQTRPATAIVANLPYLTSEEMAALPQDVQADPSLALDGGADGLDLIRPLLSQAIHLAPLLFLETGIAHGPTLTRLATEADYQEASVLPDLTGRPRFLIARKTP